MEKRWLKMDAREQCKAADALAKWFQSQDIDPADAAMVCARLCGALIVMIAKDHEHANAGAKLMAQLLTETVGKAPEINWQNQTPRSDNNGRDQTNTK